MICHFHEVQIPVKFVMDKTDIELLLVERTT